MGRATNLHFSGSGQRGQCTKSHYIQIFREVGLILDHPVPWAPSMPRGCLIAWAEHPNTPMFQTTQHLLENF